MGFRQPSSAERGSRASARGRAAHPTRGLSCPLASRAGGFLGGRLALISDLVEFRQESGEAALLRVEEAPFVLHGMRRLFPCFCPGGSGAALLRCLLRRGLTGFIWVVGP